MSALVAAITEEQAAAAVVVVQPYEGADVGAGGAGITEEGPSAGVMDLDKQPKGEEPAEGNEGEEAGGGAQKEGATTAMEE